MASPRGGQAGVRVFEGAGTTLAGFPRRVLCRERSRHGVPCDACTGDAWGLPRQREKLQEASSEHLPQPEGQTLAVEATRLRGTAESWPRPWRDLSEDSGRDLKFQKG